MKHFFTFLLTFCLSQMAFSQDNKTKLLIGTYTNTCKSDGIYIYDFNTETADFKLKSSSKSIVNPSFLALSSDKKTVYSVNENGDASAVSAFDYTSKTSSLKFKNALPSEGNDPCHIITDDKNVMIANYSGGNIAVFGKNPDGSLSKVKQTIKHYGNSSNQQRQEKPHVHQLHFSPDKKYVLATDLGTDFIHIYKYDQNRDDKPLELYKVKKVKVGSGPRHLTFSNDGKFVYLVQELTGLVSAFSYQDGELNLLQETSLLEKKFVGETSAADIHISPDGIFLYATNRGTANTISCFKIKEDGTLKLVQTISTLGKGPRNFAIDPSGNFLLVAHQYSNEVVVFRRNKTKGTLTDTNQRIKVCSPVCLVFEN
ncbi:lactonase family protein [Flavobacterium dankookense]|nr:lactonase family protein [Flavobacterium dankookense]